MKNLFPLAALAALLTACGGSTSDTATPAANKSLAVRVTQGAQRAPSDYADIVQRLYLGFFGRPAEPAGLIFWEQSFSAASLPLDVVELSNNYLSDEGIRRIVDAFANSQESQDLYSGNNTAYINAIYQNAYNRNVEASGQEFWAGFLDRQELTRAQVLLRILGGAQNSDATVLAKKLQAANYFTAALDQPSEQLAYDGASPNQGARELLASIAASTDMTAFQVSIDAQIAALVATPGQSTIARYIGFNYLQDLHSTPAYSAYYSYSNVGVAPPATTGKTVYGEVAQTLSWSREPITHALVYSAPVVSSIGLPFANLLPSMTMLCTPVNTDSGTVNKSTDILVARSARQLLDASELANQRFTVYWENCAQGGSNLSSMSFDSEGNGHFPITPLDTMIIDAVGVSKILKGEIQYDISTGKYLVYAAYRYTRNDGSTGYFIVQHLGNHRASVTNGILAVWAQE
jgi:hypothetical protein